MNTISLVFPHQLFEQNPCLDFQQKVVMVEEYLFFRQYRFHQQKLILHRASMKYYQALLKQKGFSVEYIDATESYSDIRILVKELAKAGVEKIVYCDTADNWLEKRLKQSAAQYHIQLQAHPSPNFICTKNYCEEYFKNKKKYYLTSFYTDQRFRLNVMMENNKPMGGKWTFDTDNRKKIPKGTPLPSLPQLVPNIYVTEATQYVQTNFSQNYGNAEPFIYPVTHTQSRAWLQTFLQERFAHYGEYQDAIVPKENFLFHSVLTPALNIGLLQPDDVLQEAIHFGVKNQIPVNSLEGFVRQILGWREFVRAVYECEGSRQRALNYWKHTRKLPKSFYEGNTGIRPVDDAIERLNRFAYNHHIERLMVIGNFMCLCEIHPNDIYRWFMEMYIDAYDWVMVPNVYGMSQFADGGIMSTKPYISSSNYILKMSHYEKGPWCHIWDALYWRFIYLHRSFFEKHPRMSVMCKQLDRMGKTLHKHLQVAEEYLSEHIYS
jgi:deoxyribodipyrimidine photolyase-related protein